MTHADHLLLATIIALALLAGGSLLYVLALLDRLRALGGKSADEWRLAYASEREARQQTEQQGADWRRLLEEQGADLWCQTQRCAQLEAELRTLGVLPPEVRRFPRLFARVQRGQA